MEFNLPANWTLRFKESEFFDDEDEFICYSEEYVIAPSRDSIISAIQVTRYMDIVPAPYETVEEWSDGDIQEFNMGDIPVYYFVDRNTGTDSPMIRCAFETPDYSLVIVNARVKDSKEIDSAITFLSGFLKL